MKQNAPPTIWLRDYTPSDYLIETVYLDIKLHAQQTRVSSKLRLTPNPKSQKLGTSLILHGENVFLESIFINKTRLENSGFTVENGTLTLHKPPIGAFDFEAVTIIDPSANKALQGLYQSKGVYCTQCEAEGFRRITFMLDRPDVLARYTVRLEAHIDEAPILLANGNLQERGRCNDNTHYAIWHDPHPKPSYLFAVVAGDLGSIASTFTTQSGRSVDLRIYVEHGKEPRAAWAMDCLKRAMTWDETRFNREYDLDHFNIVAVSDFNMGAMENKGLNIFNDRLILASAETATDAQFEAIESVVAHEYFHNWTGNRITCRDWFQLCLKEGLTVYRDQEFSSDERSPIVQRIADVRQLKALQFPEDAGPLAHPVRPSSYIEINNFYTATVYEKGAELVRMLSVLIGADFFRCGMALYFERYDGTAATIEDFISCFEETAGRDLSQFKQWYHQSGTPHLQCLVAYDKTNATLNLDVRQSFSKALTPANRDPVPIPIRLGLLGADGKDLPLVTADGQVVEEGVVVVTQASETFQFTGVTSKPVVSLLRGYSAPVTISVNQSDAELAFLIAHDSDLFTRWQASQTYAMRVLLQIYQSLRNGKRSSRGSKYCRTIGLAAFDARFPAAYRAELLRLPTVSDIMREAQSDIDPALVVKAHHQLSYRMASILSDHLEQQLTALPSSAQYSPDAESVGLRSLRNAVLTSLSAAGKENFEKRLIDYYYSATNMTDRAHILLLLTHSHAQSAFKAFEHFRSAWQHDDLVIDIWFATKAQSMRATVLAEMKDLLADPLFLIINPNKVRALLQTFANANPLHFHRRDGAGYAFMAEQVLTIDKFNPQVASRLVSSLRSWQTLEPVRCGLAQQTLRRLVTTEPLSKDVTEIVSRMLDATALDA